MKEITKTVLSIRVAATVLPAPDLRAPEDTRVPDLGSRIPQK
jgi:hypothetical protein